VGGVDAGITDTANVVRFSPAAVKSVAGISGGIPRLINTLCDRALEAAYERQLRIVDPDAVIAAAERLHLEVPGSVNLPGRHQRTGLIAAAVAAVLLIVGALWWFASSTSQAPSPRQAGQPPRSTAAPPASPPAASAPAGAATSPAGSTSQSASEIRSATPQQSAPPAAVTPGGAPAPGAVARPAPLESGTFQIAIAAFRTESRAQDVAAAVSGLQIPAAVRPDTTGTWYRVIGGPFPTREAAQAAQDALARAGYAGTQLSQNTSSTR
jgi:cell division septation protein DedD